MPYCPNCGTEVDKDARICATCEYPLQSVQQEPQRPAFEAVVKDRQPVQFGQGQIPAEFPSSGAPGPGGRQNDSQAVAALVLGILGIVVCPIILSIVAIVLGRQSMKRIKESGGALGGYGQAQAGFILGIIGLVLPLLIIIPIVFFAVLAGTAGFG